MQSSNCRMLVPFRFLCTTFHLLVTICALILLSDNTVASLNPIHTEEEYEVVYKSLLSAWALMLSSVVLCYIGFFSGLSTFSEPFCLIQCFLHLCGGITQSFFSFHGGHYVRAWQIVCIFGGLPVCLELGNLWYVVRSNNIRACD